MSDRILIIAHPGHELHLFHWMELYRPTVFVLTDGSGSGLASRMEYTRRTLERAGAKAGAVFGQVSDKDWYSSIINRDSRLLISAAEQIFRTASLEVPSLIVTDPVEGYNPMHDLCAGVAAAVQTMFAGRCGQPELGTYALTRAVTNGRSLERVYLDDQAQYRKQQAITAYEPLSGEAATILAQRPADLGEEVVTLGVTLKSWPGELEMPPEYEKTGRERVRDRRYANAIAYAEHIKPAFDDLMNFTEAHDTSVGMRR